MPLKSFPRPRCCLPLFNLISLLFISIPISPVGLGVLKLKLVNLGLTVTRRQTGDVVKLSTDVWQFSCVWPAAAKRASAAIFASSQEVTVAWAETSLKWPIQDQSKDHLWPTTTFFFFTLSCLVHAALLLTGGRAEICRVDDTIPRSGNNVCWDLKRPFERG